LYVRATPVPGPTPSSQTTARVVPQKVIDRLFQLKQSLSILESLGFSALDDGSDDSDSDSDGDTASSSASQQPLSEAEIKIMLAELDHGRHIDETVKAKRMERMKRAKERAQATSKPKSKPSPEAKGAPKAVAASPVFDLEEPEFVPSKSSSSTRPHLATPSSSYGEPTALDYADTEDKSARRKTLRFHTSRIESASRRRESARSGALGGDDDLPWRDMRREKQQAKDDLAAKQNRRGQGGDDLGDPDAPDSEQDNATHAAGKGKKRQRDDDDGKENGEAEEGPDGYYELVKKQKREAKQEKKAAYEAQRASSRCVFCFHCHEP
jgi:U3 small nucleolar RNA-associated protein 3